MLLAEAGVAHGPRPQDSHTAQTQAAKSPATAREPSCGVIPGRRGVRSPSSGPLPATAPSCGLQGRGGGATPAPAPLPHASGPSSMRRWSSPQGWHRGCTRASGAPPTGMGNRCWQPPEDRAHPAGGPGLVLRPPPPTRALRAAQNHPPRLARRVVRCVWSSEELCRRVFTACS